MVMNKLHYVKFHGGISVMKCQDSDARFALELSRVKVTVPYTDFKRISQYILSIWQDNWNGAVMYTLLSAKPVLGDWHSSLNGEGRMKLFYVVPTSVSHLTYSYIQQR